MRRIAKFLYVLLGVTALCLGIVGVVLPLLPTTPLLLLAAFCFVRGSRRFDRWFKGTKLYKRYVESFVRERAMTFRQKFAILAFADVMIVAGIVFSDNWAATLVLLTVMAYKYYYFVFRIKTIK